MDTTVVQAVERAVDAMRRGLGETLTVDDLARSAMFSKFHFSRMFQRTTGLTPARFLSAMRLAEAKHLLATTSVSVADISHQVGYNSVGTFSTRFNGSVGVSPRPYRYGARVVGGGPGRSGQAAPGTSVVGGRLTAAGGCAVYNVFIGLFPGRLVAGVPVSFAVLGGAGSYTLDHVPPGRWYVLAHAVGTDEHTAERRTFVGDYGPVTIRPGLGARLADFRLRPQVKIDPPALTALRDDEAAMPMASAEPA